MQANLRNKYFKDTFKNVLKMNRYKNLSKEEIIVFSIVVATIIAILLGYVFGETQYFNRKGVRVYHITEQSTYSYNYVIGIGSFIIFSGISFIYLHRNRASTNV